MLPCSVLFALGSACLFGTAETMHPLALCMRVASCSFCRLPPNGLPHPHLCARLACSKLEIYDLNYVYDDEEIATNLAKV